MKNPFKVNDVVKSVFNNNVLYIVSEASDDYIILKVCGDSDTIYILDPEEFDDIYLYSNIETDDNKKLVLNIYFNNLTGNVKKEIVRIWNEQNNTEWTVKDFESDCLNYQPIAKGTFEIDPRQ